MTLHPLRLIGGRSLFAAKKNRREQNSPGLAYLR